MCCGGSEVVPQLRRNYLRAVSDGSSNTMLLGLGDESLRLKRSRPLMMFDVTISSDYGCESHISRMGVAVHLWPVSTTSDRRVFWEETPGKILWSHSKQLIGFIQRLDHLYLHAH